jgi:hypothetical protein
MRFFVSLALVCVVSSAIAETPVPVRPGEKEFAVLVQRWVAFFDEARGGLSRRGGWRRRGRAGAGTP